MIYIEEQSREPVYIRLGQRLAVGRAPFDGTRRRDKIVRTDAADIVALGTDYMAVSEVDEERCQFIISRREEDFVVEDRNIQASVCRLNGKLFERPRKLVINDRISLGDTFHFYFDGAGVVRVAEPGCVIEASYISKIYPGAFRGKPTVALRKTSLVVEPNEFVGVLGPSGGGKSTLLGLLSGSIMPTEGRVTINGVDVHRQPALVRSIVGVVPQDDIVHPELVVWDAIRLSAGLRLPDRISHHAKNLLVETVLTRLRLWEFRHHRIRELSGGQRKRVSIATEILKNSSVMFLDEPTSGLDPNKEEELMIQLRELAEQGRTIVCTTHILDRDFLFNKVCLVAKGDVVYYGPTDEAPGFFGKRSLMEVYRLLDEPSYIPTPFSDWGRPESRIPGVPGDMADATITAIRARTTRPDGQVQTVSFTNGIVIVISVALDSSAVSAVCDAVGQNPGNVVVDFSKINGGNSTASAQDFARMHACLSDLSGSVTLVRPPDALIDIFQQQRSMERIKVEKDVESAARAAKLGTPQNERVGSHDGMAPWQMWARGLAAVVMLLLLLWKAWDVLLR